MPFTCQTMQVGQLLANPFVIEAPSYQRSYVWTDEEAGKLLEDIVSALDADVSPHEGEYFLGAMLFVERDRDFAIEELAARPSEPAPRRCRRLSEADHAHHPVLRPA